LQNLISGELAVKAAEYNIWSAQIPYIFIVVEIEGFQRSHLFLKYSMRP
jgi:hypothetical protein